MRSEIFTITSNEIVGRIDPYYYKPELKELEDRLENSKWESKKLNEIATFENEIWDQKNIFENFFSYIEISEINLETGKIENIPKIKIEEAPSRAKKIVRENDIIISLTRPYRGAISKIEKEQNLNICSTGFSVIRNFKIENLNITYLFFYLKSYISLKQMEKRMTGGNYPAIVEEELKKIKILIPPKDIQEKIISIMDSAYFLKKEAEKKAKDLIESIDDFVLEKLEIRIPNLEEEMIFEVSSEELENNRIDSEFHQKKYKQIKKALESGKYELKEVRELIEYMKKGIEVGSQEYLEVGKKFLRVADFDNFEIYENKLKYISDKLFEVNKDFQPEKEEILFSKDGTIGLCKVLEYNFDGIISSGILRIKVKENINNYFLSYLLKNKYMTSLFENLSIGQIIKHLNIENILNLKIPIPPLQIQKEIAEEVKKRLEKAKKLKQEANENLEKAKKEVEDVLLQTK